MHTYNCIFCSFFVQLQELLQRQVGRIFLKGKKTTACRVFFVFLSEKSKKKIKKTQNNKTTKPNHNRSSQQGTRRRFSLPSTSASTSPAHLHAGEELPSETLPRCRLGANRGGGPGTHTHTPPTHSGSSSGSQPSSSLKQKKHCATSGPFSMGQCTKPAAAICGQMDGARAR